MQRSDPLALLALLAAATAGCGHDSRGGLPQLLAPSDEGIVDLRFGIESRERQAAGAERIVAAAMDGEREVAFAITLEPQWKQGELEGIGLTVHQGVVVLASVGARGDHLVQAIDRLYATKLGASRMRPEVGFTAISLDGNPAALDAATTKIKLFFESDSEDRYAELFLDLDVRAGTVQLNEKDSEYRHAIVRALAGL